MEDQAALQARLRQLHEAGRAAWPGVEVPAEDFVRHLLARAPAEGTVEQRLRGLPAADLYLACACAQGDGGALAAFEEAYLAHIDALVARVDGTAAFVDEVRQRVRVRLLLSAGPEPPKIAEYAGRGDLRSFVQTVALRVALTLRKGAAREDLVEQDVLAEQVLAGAQDPEARYLRESFQRDLQWAFQEALAALTSEQRNLLRLAYVDGVGVEKLGALFQVAPSTISRRLTSLREGLAEETRRLLKDRLRLSSVELESIAGLLRSQLELSLSRLR